jgi:quercetin dioxygenase-like cupin family protein
MPDMQGEAERESLRTAEVDQATYYDYEARFIRQNAERERIRTLPRVVPPELFARGGHALGDVRVFERLTVGPLSALTCRMLDLAPGTATPRERRVPTLTLYVIAGSGACVDGGALHPFTAGDLVFVPPYRQYAIVAGVDGLRAWIPENRMWHALGLLWHEHFEPAAMPGEVTVVRDQDGEFTGYRIPRGTLGIDEDLEVSAGADQRRSAVFAARRAAPRLPTTGKTRYHTFLRMLDAERHRETVTPRVVRGADLAWEDTRQGRLRYYLHNWSGFAGQDLDVMAYEIEPGGHTGRHRHVPEELLYVLSGTGHDVHDGIEYRWRAGDLICVPPNAVHQHVNDGDEPARLISAWLRHPAHEYLGGVEHIADASGWARR